MTPPHPWVLYIHDAKYYSGCEAYRMMLPAEALRQQGFGIAVEHVSTVEKLVRQSLAGQGQGPAIFDIIVSPRAGLWGPDKEPALRQLRQAGKKLVVEVDDDFTNEYREVITPEHHLNFWTYIRKWADAILVTTEYLATRMRKWSYGKPVYVLPNSVEWDKWQDLPRSPRLTLGLTGSITHYRDWQVLATVLPDLLRRYPDVDLYIAGFIPDYFAPLTTEFGERVTLDMTWCDYRDYPARVAREDIGLCPVHPAEPFNLSKSGIKAIEILAAGGTPIATNHPIYYPVLAQGRGLLVEHTPEAWLTGISTLIEHPELRARLTAAGRARVRERYAIDRTAVLWQRAFESIWSKEQSHEYTSDDRRLRVRPPDRNGDRDRREHRSRERGELLLAQSPRSNAGPSGGRAYL